MSSLWILFLCFVASRLGLSSDPTTGQSANVTILAGDCYYNPFICNGIYMNISLQYSSSNALVSSYIMNSDANCVAANVIYSYYQTIPTMTFNGTLSGKIAPGMFCLGFCNENTMEATLVTYTTRVNCLVPPSPNQPCNDSCDLGLTMAFGIGLPSFIALFAIVFIIYTRCDRCRNRGHEHMRLLSAEKH